MLAHVKDKTQLLWERLTLSRITIVYAVFSLVHCLVQVALQVRAFTINEMAATLVWSLASHAHMDVLQDIPDLQGDVLRICPAQYIVDPASFGAKCVVVWNATAPTQDLGSNVITSASDIASSFDTTILSSPFPTPSGLFPSTTSSGISIASTRTITVFAMPSATSAAAADDSANQDSDLERRDIEGVHIEEVAKSLPENCLRSLVFPGLTLDNTKREDIVFVAFQFWVLGMSIVAILNESIPHIIASFATHLMATTWSALQIVHTAHFKEGFHRVIAQGACAGSPTLLPQYWVDRARAEYPTLALNIAALFVSVFLSWRLIKSYGWQTFKRIGASLTIRRVYHLVLAFSIALQLSFFFMIVTLSLWLESLFNGATQVAVLGTFYKISGFTTEFVLIPWLVAGWFAVRRENRRLMFAFLFVAVLYLAGWGTMLHSDTFRWTFLNWSFFAFMAILSVTFTVVAFVLGIICRINFGKGLPHFLNPKEFPNEAAPYASFDEEKTEFPTHRSSRFPKVLALI